MADTEIRKYQIRLLSISEFIGADLSLLGPLRTGSSREARLIGVGPWLNAEVSETGNPPCERQLKSCDAIYSLFPGGEHKIRSYTLIHALNDYAVFWDAPSWTAAHLCCAGD
jgi:hypothetical protein